MYKHILLTVDLDDKDSWSKALPLAISNAETHGATLSVMTVVPDFGMSLVGQYFPKDHTEKVMKEANKRLHALVAERVPEGMQVQHIVRQGTVYEMVLLTAKEIEADLIIIASHRPALKDYLLGPNAARVVRHANCSVLVVR
ncbi:universal stress protein [Nisaea nitritireducens]|uniref:universal stress protein n=1 Tax=Nisaea nitritireducens TaxID=568392 RepID=UPI001867ED24|nr:universal stress protein [Nisaea nitritireducens]